MTFSEICNNYNLGPNLPWPSQQIFSSSIHGHVLLQYCLKWHLWQMICPRYPMQILTLLFYQCHVRSFLGLDDHFLHFSHISRINTFAGKLLLETFIICREVASSMLLYVPPYCGCSCQLFLCPSLMWSFCEWIQLTRLDKHHIVTSGSGSLSQWMIWMHCNVRTRKLFRPQSTLRSNINLVCCENMAPWQDRWALDKEGCLGF